LFQVIVDLDLPPLAKSACNEALILGMKPTTPLYGNFSNDEREPFWSIIEAPGMMTANVKPKNDVTCIISGHLPQISGECAVQSVRTSF